MLLTVLGKLLGSATPCNATAALKRAGKSKKVTAARQHLASVLEGELARVPADRRKAVDHLLAKL